MLSCYWIWGLDKKNRLPKAALCPTPARRDSAFHQTSSLPFFSVLAALFSLFHILHFTFTSELTFTVRHTGLGLGQNSQCIHNCLANPFWDWFIIYEYTSTYFLATLLVFFISALLPPSPPFFFKSTPPQLTASVCSSEVSWDVCQTAQDFVMCPNVISTFCGHFISCVF